MGDTVNKYHEELHHAQRTEGGGPRPHVRRLSSTVKAGARLRRKGTKAERRKWQPLHEVGGPAMRASISEAAGADGSPFLDAMAEASAANHGVERGGLKNCVLKHRARRRAPSRTHAPRLAPPTPPSLTSFPSPSSPRPSPQVGIITDVIALRSLPLHAVEIAVVFADVKDNDTQAHGGSDLQIADSEAITSTVLLRELHAQAPRSPADLPRPLQTSSRPPPDLPRSARAAAQGYQEPLHAEGHRPGARPAEAHHRHAGGRRAHAAAARQGARPPQAEVR